MRVAFYRGTGSFIDLAIKSKTDSLYTHAALIFSDGSTFTSDLAFGGTLFQDGSEITSEADKWLILDLGPLDEATIHAFCQSQAGKKYDFLGCFDYMVDCPTRPDNRWFCSAVCTAALQAVGLFLFLTPNFTSPETLRVACLARIEANRLAA